MASRSIRDLCDAYRSLMSTMRLSLALALALILVVLATTSCTGGVPTSSPVQSSTTGPSPSSVQPVTDTQSFVAALESAGYKVKEGHVVIPPGYGGFRRLAERIQIDRVDVWVFEFPTHDAYARMRSKISDDGQRIGHASFLWTPHIYGSGRLIVLYIGSRSAPAGQALNELFGKQFAGV